MTLPPCVARAPAVFDRSTIASDETAARREPPNTRETTRPLVPNGAAQAGLPGIGDQADTDSDGLGDACDPDDDDDGLLDVDEVGLHGTDPVDPDSDDDDHPDGVEVAAGSDPLDPESTPPLAVPILPGEGVAGLLALLVMTGARLARRNG